MLIKDRSRTRLQIEFETIVGKEKQLVPLSHLKGLW